MQCLGLLQSVLKQLSDVVRVLTELIYPRLCPVCRRRLSWIEWHICPSCAMNLQHYSPVLDRGYERLYGSPLFRNLYSLYAYDQANRVKRLVIAFKYQSFPSVAQYAAQEAVRRLSQITAQEYDLIVAIPTTDKGYEEKGYNPAALLAKALSKELGAPYTDSLLIRNRKSLSQKRLNKRERQLNARVLFSINRSFRSPQELKRVLLVDDVLTTGATLLHACDRLEELGVVEVDVFTLALTI